MKTTIDINAKIGNAVYNDIMRVYGISEQECYNYITNNANINKQSCEEYILTYYETIILKDNKSDSVNIEDIDKVNFEELTETDKKVIESRKYMYNEYIKEIFYKLNELINSNLSNDRCAVDETAVIMYAVQAIERDVANAISDCQKVLKLMKSKCS
jgi:hypothetical protein